MIKIICCVCTILFVIFWMKMASKDKDFMMQDKLLEFTLKDKIIVTIYGLIAILLISRLSIVSAIFVAISIPYLIIAAITDKKTKLVYDIPFYVFGFVAIILETIMFNEFNASILIIFLFAQILASLKMFGRGDRAMVVICGSTYFFNNPEAGVIEALLITCIMILVAEVTFYIKAIKEHNLNGPFKLKESRPLGPDLCLATFIILTGAIFA